MSNAITRTIRWAKAISHVKNEIFGSRGWWSCWQLYRSAFKARKSLQDLLQHMVDKGIRYETRRVLMSTFGPNGVERVTVGVAVSRADGLWWAIDPSVAVDVATIRRIQESPEDVSASCPHLQ